ncbi:MAG TPA: thiamine-phosphate kinase, partial [Sphingomonadales bacterium]|nr:thiamine-phosphate kinase [Sphingomonadales bacterium]
MDEFALIEKFFRPLAWRAKGAFNLENDTAFYAPPKGQTLVLTTDAMIEGVHFLPSESAETVGRRLLRVNLSDLAASGAKPVGYLLNLGGGRVTPAWLRKFCAGLEADQKRFGVSLFGGDTTSGAKTLMLSLTAFGTAP